MHQKQVSSSLAFLLSSKAWIGTRQCGCRGSWVRCDCLECSPLFTKPLEHSSSITDDAFWLSISSDHRAEKAVQLEVRGNLGGSQARDGCRCLRSIPCWPRSQLVFVWALTRLRSPTHLLLPGGCPKLAAILQVLTLLQLLSN